MKELVDKFMKIIFYIYSFLAWWCFCIYLCNAINSILGTSFSWNVLFNVVISLFILGYRMLKNAEGGKDRP